LIAQKLSAQTSLIEQPIRRRRVNCVEGRDELRVELQSVRLYECERVIRLRAKVDSYNIESSPVVSGTGAAGAAEKIKQPWSPPECDEDASI
jgi:hypothetical protein